MTSMPREILTRMMREILTRMRQGLLRATVYEISAKRCGHPPCDFRLRRARSRQYLHKNPWVIGVPNTTRRDLAVGAKRKKLSVDFTMKKGRESQPPNRRRAEPMKPRCVRGFF